MLFDVRTIRTFAHVAAITIAAFPIAKVSLAASDLARDCDLRAASPEDEPATQRHRGHIGNPKKRCRFSDQCLRSSSCQ